MFLLQILIIIPIILIDFLQVFKVVFSFLDLKSIKTEKK